MWVCLGRGLAIKSMQKERKCCASARTKRGFFLHEGGLTQKGDQGGGEVSFSTHSAWRTSDEANGPINPLRLRSHLRLNLTCRIAPVGSHL